VDARVEEFTKLCVSSRLIGLNEDERSRRLNIIQELLDDDVIYVENNCNYFTNDEDKDYFNQHTKKL